MPYINKIIRVSWNITWLVSTFKVGCTPKCQCDISVISRREVKNGAVFKTRNEVPRNWLVKRMFHLGLW